ncbi:MAG: hypothetical protein WBE90_28680 [Xanthobacteraceae bacterium]
MAAVEAVVVAYIPNQERLWAFTPPTGKKAFDDWIAPQRTAAIGRILKAVGKSPNSELDLATGIYHACVETHSKLDLLEGSKASNRLNKIKHIVKALQKRIALVSADPYLKQRIVDANGVAPRPIVQLLFELQSLENEWSWLAKKWRSKADLPPSLKDRRPSELEWLAGVSLPLIYERCFLRRAARSRTKGKPGGPTVRFIEAAMGELGMPYSGESIVRAFSRLTALRNDYRMAKAVT